MCCDKWTKVDYLQLTYFMLWTITIPLFAFAVYTDILATYREEVVDTFEFRFGWEEVKFEYTGSVTESTTVAYCDGFEDAEQSDKDKWDSLCDDGKIYVAFAILSALVGGCTLILDYVLKCCCSTRGSCAESCARTLISILYCCTFVGMVMTVIIIFRLIVPNTQSETFENDTELGITPMLMIICLVSSGIAVGFNFCFGCCCDSEVKDAKTTTL